MNEEITLTMLKVPFLQKTGQTSVAVKWRIMHIQPK